MAEADYHGKNITGNGWGFPLRINALGGFTMVTRENDIEESIRIILGTARGERRMRPNFGCGIQDFVFAPNSAATWSQIAYHVEQALGWWEPRIKVMEADVHPDTNDQSRLLINIKYRINESNNERSLVYPFYLSK
jgi:phage baseplate assembly protein W